MDFAFWKWMVKTLDHPYWLGKEYGHEDNRGPVWCFDRLGQSHTLIKNQWVVSIGGEHEDFYDPNFMIYNDIVVRDFHGGIEILGYPRGVFPPTDFHSAIT
jgi:hypothetical protein